MGKKDKKAAVDKPVKAKKDKKAGADKGYASQSENWNTFAAQLKSLGLKLKDIKPDGNCLFRSIADQLEGQPDRHRDYRQAIVEYMESNADDFAPFIEGDFSQYLKKMGRDSHWGGNMELVAASRRFRRHITIHQLNAPRLDIRCLEEKAGAIHLSYHDGEHYSSVRSGDDKLWGQPTPIELDARLSKAEKDGKGKGAGGKTDAGGADTRTRNERIAMESSGCGNLSYVRDLLRDSWNDVDAVVELLMADKAEGKDAEWDTAHTRYREEMGGGGDDAGEAKRESKAETALPEKKEPKKGDQCPCGSGKKYSKCCLRSSKSQNVFASKGPGGKRAPSSSSSLSADDDTSNLDDSIRSKFGAKLSNKERKELMKLQKQGDKHGKGKAGQSKRAANEHDFDVDLDSDFGSLQI